MNDILLIPGGKGTRQIMTRQPVIDWVRDIHPTTQFTTSVCTDSPAKATSSIIHMAKEVVG